MKDQYLIAKLLAYKEKNGLSNQDIANELGVTRETISRWKSNGKLRPKNRKAINCITADAGDSCSNDDCPIRNKFSDKLLNYIIEECYSLDGEQKSEVIKVIERLKNRGKKQGSSENVDIVQDKKRIA
jgi:transcriptional regulator with XRE-family HTH domain